MSGQRPRHLILVGMMGAGKTAVGEACARSLGRAFIDTDALVEARAEASVAEIFAAEGERLFRDLERRAVDDACSSAEPVVIACGGGAVLDGDNRRRLRETGAVVWLTAAPEVLAERVGDPGGRPLLASAAPEEALSALLTAREGAYRELADVVVPTDGRSIDDVALAVIEWFSPAEDPVG